MKWKGPKGELKAYIPLRRKTICVGSWHWVAPQRHNFALEILTCWCQNTLKFALPPTRNIQFALPPMQNPNAGQWNIGCIGSPTQNFHIGHVHFRLFVLISFALGTQREPSLQWNMRYRISAYLQTVYYILSPYSTRHRIYAWHPT